MEIRCAGERESLSFLLITVLPSHTSHTHQCVLSTTGGCLAPVSLCPHPPHIIHTHRLLLLLHLSFSPSPFFDPLADIDEFPSAAQDLVKTSQESFQSEKKYSSNSGSSFVKVLLFKRLYILEFVTKYLYSCEIVHKN